MKVNPSPMIFISSSISLPVAISEQYKHYSSLNAFFFEQAVRLKLDSSFLLMYKFFLQLLHFLSEYQQLISDWKMIGTIHSN